jgi:hypothetical protein
MRAVLASSLLATACLAACHPARMEVPTALRDDAMDVRHSGSLFDEGELAFGEYAVVDVHRGWTHTRSTSVFQYDRTRSRQKFRFEVATAGMAAAAVRCETVYSEQGHDFGALRFEKGRHGLGCNVRTPDGLDGELVMLETEPQRPSGYLRHGNVTLEVVASGRFEGGRVETFDPVGYELRLSGQVVGAVQTINGGKVWIQREAPPEIQESAAVAAAAMLLYRSIEPDEV